MPDSINNYKLFCTTDSVWESVWSLTSPTVCPTNSSHTINLDSVMISDTITSNAVQVTQETIKTGGFNGVKSIKINAIKNTSTTVYIEFPYDITPKVLSFHTELEHYEDELSVVAAPDTITNYIASNLTPATAWTSQNYVVGDKVSYTHPKFGVRLYTCILNTVSNEIPTNETYWIHGYEIQLGGEMIYTDIGFYAKLDDGTNVNDLGQLINVNKPAKKIYVCENLTNSFSASTPTYFKISIYPLKDVEFCKGGYHEFTRNTLSASIPKDLQLGFIYKNKSLIVDKVFIAHLEYLY